MTQSSSRLNVVVPTASFFIGSGSSDSHTASATVSSVFSVNTSNHSQPPSSNGASVRRNSRVSQPSSACTGSPLRWTMSPLDLERYTSIRPAPRTFIRSVTSSTTVQRFQ